MNFYMCALLSHGEYLDNLFVFVFLSSFQRTAKNSVLFPTKMHNGCSAEYSNVNIRSNKTPYKYIISNHIIISKVTMSKYYVFVLEMLRFVNCFNHHFPLPIIVLGTLYFRV